MTTIDSLRILVAHASDDTCKEIADSLDNRHEIVARCGTVVELKQHFLSLKPDLSVVGVMFPDGDGIEAMIELGSHRATPSVIVTARRSLELVQKAMRDHVMAYLIEPVRAEDIEAAIVVAVSRHRELQELGEQVEDLRDALEHRKIIERAKGILMASGDLSEGEAFAQIRRDAQDRRARMIDIAHELVDKQG